MLGLLEPQSGNVLIDGLDIRMIGLKNYRSLVGAVMQDDSLLSGTIEENIAFFDIDIDKSLIKECAKAAQIDADICNMVMGYNTLIGDNGISLSGGQKQRILLARALYKKPRILFLDEATSHLDLENEAKVNQQIKNLKLTRIIVAHRRETIASADYVMELRNGKLVDQTK